MISITKAQVSLLQEDYMFINITDNKEAANKGSSAGLVYYLEKENRLDQKQEPEYWFNGQQVRVEPYEVTRKIDSNVRKLVTTMPNSSWSISVPARKRSRF